MSPNDTRLIAEYLAAIGKRLTGPDREDILAGLDGHIHEAIGVRAGESPGVVGAILAEMDPPEKYGRCPDVLLPWGLPVLWHVVLQTSAGESMEPSKFYDSSLYRFVVLPVGLVSMLAATVLGWQSSKRIVGSGGALIGLPLVALDAVFHPLLILDLILFVAWANLMDLAKVGIPAIAYVAILVGLILWFKREAADLTAEILDEARKEEERVRDDREQADRLP